jgi:pimeloyl-ACP methyl ester carboxylesterase
MKDRLHALLVHGMGSDPSWWNPFLPRLREIGIDAQALSLPSLEQNGPELWCQSVTQRIGSEPTILLGHSLGAAVCLRAALEKPVAQLILLALPPFVEGFSPQPPKTKLSVTAVTRVARYLRASSELAGQITCKTIHVVGEKDRSVPVEQARKLPFPLVVVPTAGHQLNRSSQAVTTVIKHIARFDCDRRQGQRAGA